MHFPLDVDESSVTETGIYGTPRASPSDSPNSITAAIHAFRLRSFWAQVHSSLYSDTTLGSPINLIYLARTVELHAELEKERLQFLRDRLLMAYRSRSLPRKTGSI